MGTDSAALKRYHVRSSLPCCSDSIIAAYHVIDTARPASIGRGWGTQTPVLSGSARCATFLSTALTGRGTSKEMRRSPGVADERTYVSAVHMPMAPSSWLTETSSWSAQTGSNIHTVPAASYCEAWEKLVTMLS